jgi:phage tail-like protein
VPHSRQEQRARYPLAAYNFRVAVGAEALSFAKVSGLQRELHTVTYRHGLSFLDGEQLHKFHLEKFTPITFERGVTLGARFLHEWLDDRAARAVEVSLCDEQGVPVLAWRIARAFAVKLSASALDARTNEVAIETLEVRAAGVSIVHLA